MNSNRAVAAGTHVDTRALEVVRATGRATSFRYLNSAWAKGN
ncbi:MAG: hypothetical protein R2882_14440 [Gemmatimonadales bacterium]